ncbi:MAG: hypothetical protein MK116_04420 [Phycisphaerales bacterium]|nr:hypothetical protein [Phycisphaerales bacterium]
MRPVRRPSRRGVALLLVLVAMGTATTLTLGWLVSQDNAMPVSRNVIRTSQARSVASSGMELAVAIMQTETAWRTNHDNGLLLSNHPIDIGFIDVHLVDVATELPPVEGADTIHVTVTARVDDYVQQIEAIASVVNMETPGENDMSGFSVWATGGLRMQGQSSIRRWDDAPMSSLGRRLFIGTTASSPRSIDIGPNAALVDATIVHGLQVSQGLVRNDSDLHLRRRTASSTIGPAPSGRLPSLTGQRSASSTHFNPRYDDWSSHPQDLRLGSGMTVELPPGAVLGLDSLELTSGTTVVVSGETTISVHGDVRLDDASIVLAPGASLNLACGGAMHLTGAYIGDQGGHQFDKRHTPAWSDASRITIESSASVETPWRISGETLLKAVIEAPDAELIVRDDAIIAGRVAVDELRLRHRAEILYDHSLDTGTSATRLLEQIAETGQNRISRRLNQRLRRIAERIGQLSDRLKGNTVANAPSSSRYQIAPDAAWSSSPSLREVPVELRLLMHGGDTQQWEALVTSAAKGGAR